ncbi:unnamed protein product [Closterium sp. NIES-65]|nr:unnamed protein product [Closterium sp. NIES-65]
MRFTSLHHQTPPSCTPLLSFPFPLPPSALPLPPSPFRLTPFPFHLPPYPFPLPPSALPLPPSSFRLTPPPFRITPSPLPLPPSSFRLTPPPFRLTPSPFPLPPYPFPLPPSALPLPPSLPHLQESGTQLAMGLTCDSPPCNVREGRVAGTGVYSHLMLPYLFPDLAAFPTVADLITHLRTSDTRYRAALPAEGVPLPPFCPLSPLLLRPTSLVLSRSVWRLPLAGDATLARARMARARVELAGVVEVAVEAEEGVGVAVGVVAGVEVSVAAVEAQVAEVVAVGAEAAVVAEVGEAVVEEVELVRVVLRNGAAPVVVSASSNSSSVLGTSPPLRSSVSGTLHVSVVGVLVRAPTSFAPATARGDCYRWFPPDSGIETAALGAGEAAAPGATAAVAPGASASASSGAGEFALSGTASALASLTFTLDSGASRSFFQDRTTLTPLGRPVGVSLADPYGGPVLVLFLKYHPVSAAPQVPPRECYSSSSTPLLLLLKCHPVSATPQVPPRECCSSSTTP